MEILPSSTKRGFVSSFRLGRSKRLFVSCHVKGCIVGKKEFFIIIISSLSKFYKFENKSRVEKCSNLEFYYRKSEFLSFKVIEISKFLQRKEYRLKISFRNLDDQGFDPSDLIKVRSKQRRRRKKEETRKLKRRFKFDTSEKLIMKMVGYAEQVFPMKN